MQIHGHTRIYFYTYILKNREFIQMTPIPIELERVSQVDQWEKILLTIHRTWVRSLSREGPLEMEMKTHYSILA